MSRSQVILLVFTGFLLIAGPMVWADSGCFDDSVEVAFFGNPLSPFEPYTGELNVIIGGQLFEHVPATLIIGAPKLGDDGALLVVNTVIVAFGDIDREILTEHAVVSPTDNPYVYRVNSRLNICVSEDQLCTGYFEKAYGRISFHGQIDFSTATFTGIGNGRICW